MVLVTTITVSFCKHFFFPVNQAFTLQIVAFPIIRHWKVNLQFANRLRSRKNRVSHNLAGDETFYNFDIRGLEECCSPEIKYYSFCEAQKRYNNSFLLLLYKISNRRNNENGYPEQLWAITVGEIFQKHSLRNRKYFSFERWPSNSTLTKQHKAFKITKTLINTIQSTPNSFFDLRTQRDVSQ